MLGKVVSWLLLQYKVMYEKMGEKMEFGREESPKLLKPKEELLRSKQSIIFSQATCLLPSVSQSSKPKSE